MANTTDKFTNLLHSGNKKAVKKKLKALRPQEIAEIFYVLDEDERQSIIDNVNTRKLGLILDELSQELLDEILGKISTNRLAKAVEKVPNDKAADLLGMMKKIKSAKVIRRLPAKDAKRLKKLLRHPMDTAGGLMTTEMVTVPPDITIGEAMKKYEEEFTEDTPVYIYVVDDENKLQGVVTIRTLLGTPNDKLVSEKMITDVITATYDMEQERVAHLVSKYDLFCLPVVKEDNELIGIITADDIFEVMEEEDSEDLYRIAGTSEKAPFKEPVYKKIFGRSPWLLITMIGGLLAGFILRNFEQTLSDTVALSFFIPVVLGMAGNVGIQSSTIMVRAIALGDIKNIKLFPVITKEVLVDLLIGLVFAFLSATGAFLIIGTLRLSIVILISMFLAIFLASINGVIIPFVCDKINIDPAFVAGPFVTTLNDIFGVLIYLAFANLLLIVY